MCKDYPSCDIAFNAVMPLSRAPTRGIYSRIEGVTFSNVLCLLFSLSFAYVSHHICYCLMQLHLTYICLPISLNSLDREGVRLLSPRDSQITSKNRCRCRWCHSRRCDWTQVGVRWGLRTLLCFLSRRSVVEPSWGDRGSYAFGVVFIFGSVVGPWLYSGWCNCIFMYCVKWRL